MNAGGHWTLTPFLNTYFLLYCRVPYYFINFISRNPIRVSSVKSRLRPLVDLSGGEKSYPLQNKPRNAQWTFSRKDYTPENFTLSHLREGRPLFQAPSCLPASRKKSSEHHGSHNDPQPLLSQTHSSMMTKGATSLWCGRKYNSVNYIFLRIHLYIKGIYIYT